MSICLFLFFFSSRRRHTRCSRDWSSDVCSSDLTMPQLVASSVGQRRLSVQLLAGFSGAALLLAAIGLYGVLAFNVAQRTQEIGIRMALGAQRRDVVGLVVGQGMRLALLGGGIGLAAALVLSRVLQTLLFEGKPGDPLTFATVSLVLMAVALLA